MKFAYLKKIIHAKFSIFLVIGLFGLLLNLSTFAIYINFFTPTFSSFLAFSTAVIFNYLCHGKFLWKFDRLEILLLKRFLKFYSGYSFSMVINIFIVYFFQDTSDEIILVQLLGIVSGSLLNFFVSKLSFVGSIK